MNLTIFTFSFPLFTNDRSWRKNLKHHFQEVSRKIRYFSTIDWFIDWLDSLIDWFIDQIFHFLILGKSNWRFDVKIGEFYEYLQFKKMKKKKNVHFIIISIRAWLNYCDYIALYWITRFNYINSKLEQIESNQLE